MTEPRKVTIRAAGKAHRGVVINGHLYVTCSCPGSKNGRLANQAKIICDGHEQSNCGN